MEVLCAGAGGKSTLRCSEPAPLTPRIVARAFPLRYAWRSSAKCGVRVGTMEDELSDFDEAEYRTGASRYIER